MANEALQHVTETPDQQNLKEKILKSVENLPPMPNVILKIQRLLADPNSDVKQIVKYTALGYFSGGLIAMMPDWLPPLMAPRPMRDTSSKRMSFKRFRKAFVTALSSRGSSAGTGSLSDEDMKVSLESFGLLWHPRLRFGLVSWSLAWAVGW